MQEFQIISGPKIAVEAVRSSVEPVFYHPNATALQRKAHPPAAPQPLDLQQPPLSPPLCPVPTHPAPLRCPRLKWTFSSKTFQAPRLGSFPDPRFGNRMEAPGILWTLELFSASAPLFWLPATPVRTPPVGPSSPRVRPLVPPHPLPARPPRAHCPPLFRAPPPPRPHPHPFHPSCAPLPRSTPRPPRGASRKAVGGPWTGGPRGGEGRESFALPSAGNASLELGTAVPGPRVSPPAGPGAVPVLREQGLQENHLPQLAPRLQRGPDHVHAAHGAWTG